jgi:hypothetical protein
MYFSWGRTTEVRGELEQTLSQEKNLEMIWNLSDVSFLIIYEYRIF